MSACEFAVHCQFAHEPDDTSSSDGSSSLESDIGVDTDSESGTEKGEVFFHATSQIRHQERSMVSAFGDGSAVSTLPMSMAIDAIGVAYTQGGGL